MLLKRYKNELFDFLKTHPIGVEAFTLTQTAEDVVSLRYQDSKMVFEIKVFNNNLHFFQCRWTFLQNGFPLSEYVPAPPGSTINGVLNRLATWLKNDLQFYIDEKDMVDLWEQHRKGETILDIERIDFNDRSNFSFDERRQIQLALNELKLLIQNKFETSAEEQKLVAERLDYLKETSERVNRFDWKNLAINTIIAISITLSLDTKSGQELFNLFKQVFRIMPLLFGGDAN
jgi:hypothetical protein